VDFVQSECACSSSAVLGGINTIVPFVYYFFHLPKHEAPGGAADAARKALYLVAFARPFSRYADSRIGAFVRGELRPVVSDGTHGFPLEAAIRWTRRWERVDSIESLAERNVVLTLHLVQGLTGAKVQYTLNARILWAAPIQCQRQGNRSLAAGNKPSSCIPGYGSLPIDIEPTARQDRASADGPAGLSAACTPI